MTDATPAQLPAMSPRQRRLMADYEAVRAQLAGHPNIHVEPIGVMPPEFYRLTYRLKSLRLDGDQPYVAEEHIVDLRLPLGYPKEQPLVVPRTEVFHPNVDDTKYCIADYWAAGQPLADIITKVGDMLQFRVYNVKSPLNGDAAAWVRQNEELLPIGDADLGSQDFDIELRPAKTPVAAGAVDSVPAAESAESDNDELDVTLRREESGS